MENKFNQQILKQLIPLDYNFTSLEKIKSRSLDYYNNMKKRRTVRDFSKKKINYVI